MPLAPLGISLEAVRMGGAALEAVIAPPHPLYGGHLSNPVVNAIGRGLVRRGIGALAFNWRGAGTSDGRASGDLAAACEDYRAALALVAAPSSGAPAAHDRHGRVVAAGYSYGAVAALTVAIDDERVSDVIAVAPPVGMLPPDLGRALSGKRVHVIAAERDSFAPPEALEAAFRNIACVRVTIVEGADHFFSGGTEGVFDAVSRVT